MTVIPIAPMLRLYTREYTGDGHVIKAKTSYTWSGTDTTRVIESIQFDGGYFDSGGGANYYVKDYLGNIIAVVDEWGHLVRATDYYPYGLPFRMPDIDEDNNATAETGDTGSGSTSNRYLFGGKEFLTEDGLNEYYQEARQYIPRIPRFDRMDDKIDDHRDQTPYLAFAGNPIMCADPDGCDSIYAVNKDGSVYGINTTGSKDPNKYIVSQEKAALLIGAESPGPMENGPDVAIIVSGIAEYIRYDVKRSNEVGKETGGHVDCFGHKRWMDGKEYDPKTRKQSIILFKTKTFSITLKSTIKILWHVHAAVSGYRRTGMSNPSCKDRQNDAYLRENHFRGSAFVVGARDKKATFYYKDSTIATIKLEDLYRLTK